MLITSRPLSVGSFFTSRSRLRSNVRAVASSRSRSSRVTSLIEMKCRRGGGAGGRKVLAHVVGPDRQLAVAAVDEDGELDPIGPAVVEQRLDRGADRPARVEDVVDEHDRLPLEREVER